MMTPRRRFRLPPSAIPDGRLLFVLVVACTVALQAYYLTQNTTPQHGDSAHHIKNSMRVARALESQPLEGFIDAAVRDYFYYPPGYYLATAPAFLLFGYDLYVGIAWQMLYLVLTLLVLYRLTAASCGRTWGAFAALVYAAFPIVLGLGRVVYLENLLALQVVLFVYLLTRDDAFSRPAIAMLAGLVAGWGQSTKWQFGMFVGPFAAALLIRHIRLPLSGEGKVRSWKPLVVWMAIACGACALLALPWYALHFEQVVKDVHHIAYVSTGGSQSISEPAAAAYYLQAFAWQLIGLPITAILFSTFIVALRFPGRVRYAQPLVVGLLVAIGFVTLASHKQGRFIAPLLPVCVFVMVGVVRQWRPCSRGTAVAVLLLFSGVNCVSQTWNLSGVVPAISVPIGFGRSGYIVQYGIPEWILLPIQRENWALDEIFEEIVRTSRREGIAPTVAWQLRNRDFQLYYQGNGLSAYAYAHAEEVEDLGAANFRVCRQDAGNFYADGALDAGRRVHTIGRWTLPDRSEVRLYRAVAPDEPAGVIGR